MALMVTSWTSRRRSCGRTGRRPPSACAAPSSRKTERRSATSDSSPTSPPGSRSRRSTSNPRSGSGCLRIGPGRHRQRGGGRNRRDGESRRAGTSRVRRGKPLRGGSDPALPPRFADYWKELSVYASGLGPGNERRNIEVMVLSKSGAEIPVQLTLAEKVLRGQKIRTAILRDISDRKALEQELRLQSITDTLTELYNCLL